MAVATNVPWDTIKERYAKGVQATVLAQEFGVSSQAIYQRAARLKWRAPVAKVEAAAEEAVKGIIAKRLQEALPVIDDVVERYKRLAMSAAEGLVGRVAETLPQAAPRDLSGLASALLSSDTVARRTLGLDIQTEEARTIAVAVQFPSLPVVSRPYTGAAVDCVGTTASTETTETLAIQPENK